MKVITDFVLDIMTFEKIKDQILKANKQKSNFFLHTLIKSI